MWNLKKNVALRNFNIGVKGKILKCATPWKELIAKRNGWKLWLRGSRNCICMALSCQIIRVQFMITQYTLQNVRCYDFQLQLLHSFHLISTKLCMGMYGSRRRDTGYYCVWWSAKFKNVMTLWFFVNTEIYVVRNLKALFLIRFYRIIVFRRGGNW